MKTATEAPTGFIVLGKGEADVSPGMVWRMGTYFKADHFFNGLSFLLGFTYEQQNRTHVVPCDQTLFNRAHVNNDERLRKWARTIIQINAEYDFGLERSCVGPRLGFFYNREITGLRVFEIHTLGGYFGIDINWNY